MLGIHSIHPGSPASRAGLKNTDMLITCNGKQLSDWVDFAYCANGTSISIEYKRGLLIREKVLRRIPGAGWGLDFEGQSPRTCTRKCIFCFVDQLPPGVRSSLLLKDDDIRYSFFHGTYVTLNRSDVHLAIQKKLSPVHVSVHTADPFLRGRLLGTGKKEPVIPFLKMLSDADISIETQIVIVPEWNNGAILDETLAALFSIPGVTSVGVVPVGLTSFRKGLRDIRRPTSDEAAEVIRQCDIWRRKAENARGTGWVYPSDEFFILAETEIPDSGYYEECTLRENGIGLLADLLENEGKDFPGRGLVCTGTMAAPFMKRVLAESTYQVVTVNNTFFGPDVGVSGLLTGIDIVRSVKTETTSCNTVILPRVMFNHDMLTLDDLTPQDLERLTGQQIKIVYGMEELV